MKRILLTRGLYAKVDDEDYEVLSQFKWCALFAPSIKSFYAVRGKPAIRMHRLIMGLTKEDKLECDHINHDTLDNRRCNLRIVTRRQNHENRRDQSRYGVGVYIDKRNSRRQFWAEAQVNGRTIHLGYFFTPEEAQEFRKEFLA